MLKAAAATREAARTTLRRLVAATCQSSANHPTYMWCHCSSTRCKDCGWREPERSLQTGFLGSGIGGGSGGPDGCGVHFFNFSDLLEDGGRDKNFLLAPLTALEAFFESRMSRVVRMAAVPQLRLCRRGMNKAFLLNGNGPRLHGNQHSRFEAAIVVQVSGIGIGGGPGGGDAGVELRTLRKTQLLNRCATQGSRLLTSEDSAAVYKSSPPFQC